MDPEPEPSTPPEQGGEEEGGEQTDPPAAPAAVRARAAVPAVRVAASTVRADNVKTYTATCKVTVKAAEPVVVPVERVTIGSKPTDPIKVGAKFTLTAEVLPEAATDKAVTWTSSDAEKATVNAATGAVEALATGEVTITAKAGEKSDTYTFTVQPKDEEPPKDPSVTSVTVTPDTATIKVGGTQQLTANVVVENGAAQTVTWESSDTSIATVNGEGLVTADATATGTVTIKATSTVDESKFGTCTITVTGDEPDPPVRVTKVTITNTPTSKISVDDTFDLDAVVEPDNATNQTVTWTTSDPAKASVAADGLVTALQDGEVTITATADGQSDSYTLTIYPKSPEIQVKIEPASLDMVVGDTATLRVVVSPDDTVEREIEWENSSTAITVDNDGKVTALAQGDTNLWVKVTIAGELYTARCAISVKEAEPQPVPVESVSLNKDTLSLEVDGEETLIATVNPDNADEKTVTWSSADEAIAQVDETGKVTAVGEGTTTITATAGGQSATCEVTVNAKTPVTVTVTGVELTPTELTAKKGDTLEKLVATVKPEDATNKNVTWTSSNEAVVTVDTEGNVTIVGEGDAIITVTTEDGNHTATCTITVSAADSEEPTEPGGGQGGSESEETTPSEPGTEEPGTTE